jgi:predicted SnoaL-like aldol condensation-catalyzing enzyme
MEAEQAKAVVQEYFHRLFNLKDLSVCEALLAPDYVDHDAPPDTPPGPADPRRYLTEFLCTYPDMQVEVKDILAEGHKVAVRNVWRGTHKDTGQLFHQMGIAIWRLSEAGQLAERWSAYTSLA